VEHADKSSQTTREALTKLGELQQNISEMERSVAYQVERLKRQADRVQWIHTGVILLALMAGLLGGIGAALAMLNWIR
jgi:hypothetical protein